MGNVRFIRASQNVGRKLSSSSSTPRIINGNGAFTAAPALVEEAGFPMSNVLLTGRSARIWHCNVSQFGGNDPSANTDVLLDIDIGAPRSIAYAGLLGMAPDAGAVHPQTVWLQYNPNATYHGVTGWLTASTAIGGVANRDFGRDVGPITARWWRFRFLSAALAPISGFTCSGVVLSTTPTDIGFLYSGSNVTRVRPRTVAESYSRDAFFTRLGNEYRLMELEFANVDAATLATMDAMYSEDDPFLYIAPDGGLFECVFTEESFTRSHIWSPPDRYRMTVGLRSLP